MKWSLALTAAVAGLLSAHPVAASPVVYDNTANPSVAILFNGAQTVNGNLVANIDVDDITVAPGAGGSFLTAATFRAFNSNAVAVSARPTLYLWAANGAGGTAGTFLGQFVLPVTSFAPGAETALTASITPGSVVIPANGQFFAGIGFDNDFGASPITADQLNALGGRLYGPPTVGSSDPNSLFFGPPNSGPFNQDNPALIPFAFAGYPNNYGFQFAAVPAPEPATLAVFAGVCGLGGLAARRRLKATTTD